MLEKKSKKARNEFEKRIKDRTDELNRTIDSLNIEVAERKRVEEALRESEAKLRGLYELSPLGIALTDMKGRYVEFNESFRRISGYSEKELKALDYWTLTPKKYEAEEARQLEALARVGHYGPFEKEYVRRDGTLIPLRLSGVLVTDRDGDEFIWSVVEDITEHKRSEEALRRTRDELETRVQERTAELVITNRELSREVAERRRAERELQELNETLEQRVALRTAEAKRRAEELEQFAYVTSHDLKAPLRGIANLATWLKEDLEGKLSTDTAEQFALLQDRVGRMQALIEGLLEYSRVGRTHGVTETVDTRALLEEIAGMLSLSTDVVIDIAPEMPVLHTDRLRLAQVFANLIGNAVKHHTGSQVHIWVTVREKGRFYEFSVADDGPGIAPQYGEKVFMMFQTLTPRDVGNDSGIGLALVKKIVEEKNGLVTLESEDGKGSTFRFTWPK
jgi:PAS domain S-box-containing protein